MDSVRTQFRSLPLIYLFPRVLAPLTPDRALAPLLLPLFPLLLLLLGNHILKFDKFDLMGDLNFVLGHQGGNLLQNLVLRALAVEQLPEHSADKSRLCAQLGQRC